MTGTLLLGGAPLGNPADASSRLRAALVDADLVAAEDSRRLARLLADLGLARSGPVVSYYEAVEQARWPRLAEVLEAGGTVLLITDAGMPGVSDPGYRATTAALAAGHHVSVLPGPSAVTTALAVSGLPSDRFCFEGFLPRRPGELRSFLAGMADEVRTQVYFESPRRTAAALAEMAAAFRPDRPAAVCRELTKKHEEIRRGTLGELAQWASAVEALGEITIVVAGAPTPSPVENPAALATAVGQLVAGGMSRSDAVKVVAKSTGVPKRLVYDAALRGSAG